MLFHRIRTLQPEKPVIGYVRREPDRGERRLSCRESLGEAQDFKIAPHQDWRDVATFPVLAECLVKGRPKCLAECGGSSQH